MEIGSFVKGRRKELKLTQQQLADKAGVGLNFVYQLEKNKPTVQLDCTRQVLSALGYELSVERQNEAAEQACIIDKSETEATATNNANRLTTTKSHLPWD